MICVWKQSTTILIGRVITRSLSFGTAFSDQPIRFRSWDHHAQEKGSQVDTPVRRGAACGPSDIPRSTKQTRIPSKSTTCPPIVYPDERPTASKHSPTASFLPAIAQFYLFFIFWFLRVRTMVFISKLSQLPRKQI